MLDPARQNGSDQRRDEVATAVDLVVDHEHAVRFRVAERRAAMGPTHPDVEFLLNLVRTLAAQLQEAQEMQQESTILFLKVFAKLPIPLQGDVREQLERFGVNPDLPAAPRE